MNIIFMVLKGATTTATKIYKKNVKSSICWVVDIGYVVFLFIFFVEKEKDEERKDLNLVRAVDIRQS